MRLILANKRSTGHVRPSNRRLMLPGCFITMQFEDTEMPCNTCMTVCVSTDVMSSDTLLCRHQERVDVLKTFKFRLVDLLDHIIVIRCELDGLIGELGVKVVQSELP